MERYSADTAELAHGCVELSVSSRRVLPVSVPGVISCNVDQDCPAEQRCNAVLVCDDGSGVGYRSGGPKGLGMMPTVA